VKKTATISKAEKKKSTRQATSFFKPVMKSGLTIHEHGDIHEQEAEQSAAGIFKMPSDKFNANSIQRKFPAGEKKQRKEKKNNGPSSNHILQNYVAGLDTKGDSLPKEMHEFFAPRFGYDFSKVKLHTDAAAAKSAQDINALAYTTGNNIVFNSSQFSPQSAMGEKILAHELTHVVQQNGNATGNIQRMTIGSPPAPTDWPAENKIRVVPASDADRVSNAISMIRVIATNPDDYKDCIRVFSEHCPGKSPTAFKDAFDNAVIWKGDNPTANAQGDQGGHNIMYTQGGYDQGTRGLAKTLIHEMGHNCGITGGSDHYLAAASSTYCLAEPNIFSFRFGGGIKTDITSFALTYRRLFDLALGGQLQFTLGADADIIGITAAAMGAPRPFEQLELGSVTGGFKGRSNLLWGGESFGGLTLGFETGVDVGRFKVTRTTGANEFEYGPGIVLQTTLGAEFYIPINPHIMSVGLEVGHRYIRPLNQQAKEIHEIVFGIGGRF